MSEITDKLRADDIVERLRAGSDRAKAATEPLSRMAAIYGVHKTLISQIRRRKLWTHI